MLLVGDAATWTPIVLLAWSLIDCHRCKFHVSYKFCSIAPSFARHLFYLPSDAVCLLPAGMLSIIEQVI